MFVVFEVYRRTVSGLCYLVLSFIAPQCSNSHPPHVWILASNAVFVKSARFHRFRRFWATEFLIQYLRNRTMPIFTYLESDQQSLLHFAARGVAASLADRFLRSEERRVGEGWVGTGSLR